MFGYELISTRKLDELYLRVDQLTKQRDKAKAELADVLYRRGETVDGLVADLRSARGKIDELIQYVTTGDDARRSLGEKNRALREEVDQLNQRIDDMEGLLAKEREKNMTSDLVQKWNSADKKPVDDVPDGFVIVEDDTKNVYQFDAAGRGWVQLLSR